jgi:serine/threonine protein kinase
VIPGRTVLKALGGGNRFEVYLVWDDHMHATCVAKLVRPDRASDRRALRELDREAELLETLAHPAIVRGFDAVLDCERPHLMAEHLEGPSLRRLLRLDGPLPPERLLPLALSIADALHYMEGEGFVHLDVKPDNIVMAAPARLIDLSIARSLERAERSRGPLGTDAYMAPEQCVRRPEEPIGPPADVWGLGATLHHAISGERPFPRPKQARHSPDPDVRFPQLHSEPAPLPGHVDAEIADLIEDMLEPDPADRPTAAGVAERIEGPLGIPSRRPQAVLRPWV